MRRDRVVHILLFVSVVLFSACSNTQPKVNKGCSLDLKSFKVACPKKKIVAPKVKVAALLKEENLSEISTENWEPFTVADEVEWNSKELLGKRYVWGATGPHCYDCSAFVQKVYRDIGIKLPRVSRQQAKKGEYVRFENLKKGDLVFFDTKRRGKRRVTHVGIYLGNGDFIHASSAAKKVIICNFKKKCFYKKCFMWGRRIIESKQYVASSK